VSASAVARVARFALPAGSRKPSGPWRFVRRWTMRLDDLVGDRAHVVGERHEMLQAEVEPNRSVALALADVDAGVPNAFGIGEGANGDLAFRGNVDPVQSVSIAGRRSARRYPA
jgi:hypothetical protein